MKSINKNIIWLWFLVILADSVFGAANAQSLQISTTVDRTTLALNQQLALTIELSGEGAAKVGQIAPPEMAEYLTYLGSGGTSQSIQFINGRMSVSKSFSYYYMAAKEGTFEIPAVKTTYEGKEYSSNPVTISIVKTAVTPQGPKASSPAAEQSEDIGNNLYVNASINKRRVYQNEPIIISYRIYTRVDVASYGINKLPETAGFWAEEFDLQGQNQAKEEAINGVRFLVVEIKRTALFPTSPGEKTIGPLVLDCDVRLPRRRSRDVFDSFFNDPFISQTTRKTIASQQVQIQVMPLPQENRPGKFSGLVGSFTLDASIDKTTGQTNEAMTLKVKISGNGNVKMIPKPDVIIPKDFEVYEPKVSESIQRTGNTISGSKSFEYVLIPRFAGSHKIQPIALSFFDLASQRYKTINSPEFVINITKGRDDFAGAGSGLSKEEVRFIGQDIRFIKLGQPKLHRMGAKNYSDTFFWILVIVPLFGLIAAFGYQRHVERMTENVAYARSRRANTMAMKKLSKSRNVLSESTQKEFFREVSRALSGFAADKLNLPEAGLISLELEALLLQKGLPPDLVRKYLELIQECDQQRFAPATMTEQGMLQFYQRAKEALIQLDKAL